MSTTLCKRAPKSTGPKLTLREMIEKLQQEIEELKKVRLPAKPDDPLEPYRQHPRPSTWPWIIPDDNLPDDAPGDYWPGRPAFPPPSFPEKSPYHIPGIW